MAPRLLFGFDTESPYGPQAKTDDGKRALDQTMLTVMRLNELFDSYDQRRTFFLLGSFLENAEEEFGGSSLREIFVHPKVDLQLHGYSHIPFRAIVTRPDKVPLTAEQVYEDVLRSKNLTQRIFGGLVGVNGIRAPLGYAKGLEGCEEIASALTKAGMQFVSSDLRDKDWGICPPLEEDGALRLPRRYASGLLEIPSHGWQDTVFVGSKTKGAPDFSGMSKKELRTFITGHYKELMDLAIKTDQIKNYGPVHAIIPPDEIPIVLGGCFHPQAIYAYDRDLSAFREIIEYALKNRVYLLNYSDILKVY